MQSMRKRDPAILVMGGAFCPVHSGHVAALEAAREHVETHVGVEVVAGYFACAPSIYCTRKYKGKSIPESVRLDMCNLIARQPGNCLCETPQAFGCAKGCADFMKRRDHTADMRVFIVCGADKLAKRRKGDHIYISRTVGNAATSGTDLVSAPKATLHVSATLVRNELSRIPLVDALQHVVSQGMIPRVVADYIATHPEAFSAIGVQYDGKARQCEPVFLQPDHASSAGTPLRDCLENPERGSVACIACEGGGLLLGDLCPLCDGAGRFFG